MDVTVSKLKKDTIFTDEYLALVENNVLDFKSKGVCVLYGPNGTGKTSLSKVLKKDPGTEYTIKIDGNTYTEKDDNIAHVISDQNDRNLIQGETQDFILGDNIKREYELKERINNNFKKLFAEDLNKLLKSRFGISTKNTEFDHLFLDEDFFSYVSDIANNKSKGSKIDRDAFIDKVYNEKLEETLEVDSGKFEYFVSDYKDKKSTIRTIIEYKFSLSDKDKKIAKLEEQNEAVKLLEKYNYIDDCLVCDHPIDAKKMLAEKNKQFEETNNQLDDEEKKIAERIIKGLPLNDPFKIRERVHTAISKSDRTFIDDLVADFQNYKNIYWFLLKNEILEMSIKYNLNNDNDEYKKLVKTKPKFDSEDILFIENFLNEALERPISLERDKNNNIKLLLGGKDFLNKERRGLSLSNGEQNFLSLSFELLKAKNTERNLIVLDDPISSFDSIYKNKLAYAILSFLAEKKTLILTHNTDLIKLLEHQKKECFNLYYFNNVVDENNGFIPVNNNEVKILLYIHEFLELLRHDIKEEIVDEREFLISVIPFMRGFCQILGRKEDKNKLTNVMHGYSEIKENITEIYESLFSDKVLSDTHNISASDIINMDSDKFKPIKSDKYPLLAKSLRHTMNYLFLRLSVENHLVNKFKVNTKKYDMLSDIILQGFSFTNDTPEKGSHRVFFMSRKTLLNEFNHFEMDMNIFQPAIDITDKALNKEKQQILSRLKKII